MGSWTRLLTIAQPNVRSGRPPSQRARLMKARITTALDCSVPSRERHQEYRTHAQIARRDAAAAPRGPLRARSRRGHVEQCTAYACPVQPYAPAAPTRRPPPTCCSATARAAPPCHGMPYAALIRPREKHPRNPHLRRRPKRETAGQAPATLHEVRARPAVVVAGVQDHRATVGFRSDGPAGQGACPMQPPGRLPY